MQKITKDKGRLVLRTRFTSGFAVGNKGFTSSRGVVSLYVKVVEPPFCHTDPLLFVVNKKVNNKE